MDEATSVCLSATPITMYTGVYVEERSFSWQIDGYDVVRQSNELLRKQQIGFRMGQNIGLSTEWSAFLTGADDDDSHVGVFFKLLKKPSEVEEVNFSFTLTINKPNGEKFWKATAHLKNVASTETNDWGYPRIVERDAKVETLPLVDGSLIINVDIQLYANKPATLNMECEKRIFEEVAIKELSKDLGKLPDNYEIIDDMPTEIVSMDNERFPVNRAILAARSDVFLRMFQAQMTEAETGKVNLNDISGKTVRVLLQYINTGTLHYDWIALEVLEELPYVAQKYELELLLDFLDKVLGTVCKRYSNKELVKVAVMTTKLGMKRAAKELFMAIKETSTSLEDLVMIE